MKQRRIRRPPPLIPAFMIASGALLMAATLTYGLLHQQPAGSASAPLPITLAGLARIDITLGEEAIRGINAMHRLEFELTSGAIGKYSGPGGSPNATIWASGTARESLAGDLVIAMRDRIELGRSPFTPVGERIDGRRTVYELTGIGQQHFYFQSGDLVIWLAADPKIAEGALQEALAYYD